jgi:hypothetical protein
MIPALILFGKLFSHSAEAWTGAARFWCIATTALSALMW